MNVIVTTNKKEKYHYDEIKEIHMKDWSSLMVFDKDGSMDFHRVNDIVKVEIVIEENKRFKGKMAVYNE